MDPHVITAGDLYLAAKRAEAKKLARRKKLTKNRKTKAVKQARRSLPFNGIKFRKEA